MFKWPDAPAASAPVREMADFAELLAWRNGTASTGDMIAAVNIMEENDDSERTPGDTRSVRGVEETFLELEFRAEACGNRRGYPFRIDKQGDTLRLDTPRTNPRSLVYKFLLLATRLNMRTDRMHAGIDGALLFERLCAQIARAYYGPRAKSAVFGTGTGSAAFRNKVDDLCRRLEEGGGFRVDGTALYVRDGKLDIVAWAPFADRREGKSILFGQCKTGTNYKDSLTQLQPDSFCRKWLRSQPALPPIRGFFISEALSAAGWYDAASDAGLLFDRCRIMDFCNVRDPGILADIRSWTSAAAEVSGLPTD